MSPALALPAENYTHQLLAITADTPQSRDAQAKALDADVVVFSKSFLPSNETLAREARSRGLRVIFDVCDDHFDDETYGPHYKAMCGLADQVVCNTSEMAKVAQAYSQRPPMVIEDPYEGPKGQPAFAPGERLKLLWFGHGSNFDSLQAAFADLAAFSERHPVSLTVLTQDHPTILDACASWNASAAPRLAVMHRSWSLEGQWTELAACDVVVIPSLQTPKKLVKSANRLIEGLRAGRPVAAQPVPSYLPFADWTPVRPTLSEGLTWLLEHRGEVPGRIATAQLEIERRFNPARLAGQWAEVLAGPAQKSAPQAAPVSAGGSGPPVKLNLGCGDKILEGFTNVDVVESRAGQKPDVICDLHALTPFADNSADEVMAIHVVEHFWRWEVVDILREWVRVLKPGGRMILECPNLLSACEAVLADPEHATLPGQEGQRSMWVLYGDPRWKDPLMVHRWGYTPQSLAAVMRDAGLGDLQQEPAQYKLREPRDMRITGVKPA